MRRAILSLFALTLAASSFAASVGGTPPVPLPLFPPNNWWNTDVSKAPVDGNSGPFIGTMSGSQLHPDFGDFYLGHIIGFPFIVVDSSQPKLAVNFEVPEESDGVDHVPGHGETAFPFYPIPPESITQSGWIEYGDPGNVDSRPDADRHMLIVDSTNNWLYEIYNVWYDGAAWQAFSGAFFDMNTNNRRPEGWTSSDAAGLAILPGLVRYDEVFGPDEINHAFRVTVNGSNGHVYPASHSAGSAAGKLPMGARLRLKSTVDISAKPAAMQKIFRAMKKYGLIVADNGSNMYVSGQHDTRWDSDVLNTAFHSLHGSDFEVVQQGWQPAYTLVITINATLGSGDPTSVAVTAYDTNYNLGIGYRGTIHFTATEGVGATLPADYAFTAADNGSHTFSGGVVLHNVGRQTITAADTVDQTITALRIVNVGPPTPTLLVATASSTTQVGLTWAASAGAAQYEVVRNGATIGTAPSANYTDSVGVVAGTTYVYKVRAVDSSSRLSPYSAIDIATTILFTDDPLVATSTRIKIVHMTELRQAVNAMRTAAALDTMIFTDASLAGVKVKAVHVQEVRTALNAARTALGLSTIAFTDPTLTAQSTKAKAAHLQEIRNAVK